MHETFIIVIIILIVKIIMIVAFSYPTFGSITTKLLLTVGSVLHHLVWGSDSAV